MISKIGRKIIVERICPLCNGLKEMEVSCPICNSKMYDAGPIENFYDDYSPYLDQNITQAINKEDLHHCVHLFKCSKCKKDKRVSIFKEIH
jgi:hypothetical protein